MATVPAPRTWVDNDLVTPEMMNTEVRDALNFLLGPPRAQIKVASSFTADAGANIDPTFDTIVYDTDGMVDLATLPNGLTVQTTGLYLVLLSFDIQVPTLTANRGTVFGNLPSGQCAKMARTADWASNNVVGAETEHVRLSAGDTVKWRAFMSGGAGHTATLGVDRPISLSLLRVAA